MKQSKGDFRYSYLTVCARECDYLKHYSFHGHDYGYSVKIEVFEWKHPLSFANCLTDYKTINSIRRMRIKILRRKTFAKNQLQTGDENKNTFIGITTFQYAYICRLFVDSNDERNIERGISNCN